MIGFYVLGVIALFCAIGFAIDSTTQAYVPHQRNARFLAITFAAVGVVLLAIGTLR